MWLRSALLIYLVVTLTACGGATRAPVSDRSLSVTKQPKPNEYQVRRGDTLYSIAFRYGLDYRQLAQNNGIDSSFNIYPGQRLSLSTVKRPQQESIVRDSSIQAPKPIIVSSKAPTKTTPQATKVKSSPRVPHTATNSNVKPVSSKSAQPKSAAPKAKASSSKEVVKPVAGPLRWRWPANGRVIAKFNTRGTVNKGINISGAKGSPVKAAGRGRVVYAGSGLLGYGNLVIIDHNQQYLSAYAHNSRVLVKENDMVSVGQKIAEMGSSGADRVMLHFEIRRDGKPVNPLKYLPKR